MTRRYRRLHPIICLSCKKEFKPRTYTTVCCSQQCVWDLKKLPPLSCPVVSKRCSKCGVEKSRDEFGAARNKRDGMLSWCRQCYRDRIRADPVMYRCCRCSKDFIRVTPFHSEHKRRVILCSRCSRKEAYSSNGGRPHNWKGFGIVSARDIAGWRANAIRRGHVWEIDTQYLEQVFCKQQGICALSGIIMVEDRKSPYRPSLDRIESGIGYLHGNVQFVCSALNMMKGSTPQNVFLRLCATVASYQSEIKLSDGVYEDSC